jgi:hypothetical protein
MIKLLLFAILFVIAWPVALLIGLGWCALLILRVCFGITILGVKAVAATGIGIGAKMLHASARSSEGASHDYRTGNRVVHWRPSGPGAAPGPRCPLT